MGGKGQRKKQYTQNDLMSRDEKHTQHELGNTYVKVLTLIISGITDGGKTVGRVASPTEGDDEKV